MSKRILILGFFAFVCALLGAIHFENRTSRPFNQVADQAIQIPQRQTLLVPTKTRADDLPVNSLQSGQVSQDALIQTAPAEVLPESRPSNSGRSFQEKLDRLRQQIPVLHHGRAPLPKNLHQASAEELQEGIILARMRKYELANPQYQPQAQIVYRDCAEESEYSNSVRALCYIRALELSLKLENSDFALSIQVPARVRQLALHLEE